MGSGQDTQQQYYSGSASGGTLLKTVSTTYNGDLPQTITTTLPVPGGSISSQTQITYDSNGYGNTVEKQDWGYYTGSPGTAFRTTQYTYLVDSDNNMVNKKATVAISGSGITTFTTTINYDNYGSGQPAVVTGAYGHDDAGYGQSYTARGNPTSIVGLGTTTLSYDTTGQVLSSKDQNNNTTTFSYADNFYTDSGTAPNGSGASAPQAYTPSQLTNAYVKTITPTLNGPITLGHYYGSGKLAISTDQNAISSVFHYLDGFNWDRPSTSYLPAGEWLLNNYSSATQVDTYKGITDTNASTGCSSCVQQQASLDGLGRLNTSSLVRDPEGEATITTSYGQNGRVYSVTNAKRSTSSPTDGTSSLTYDPLGRVTQITDQDGSVAKTYYGPQVTTYGGNASQSCSSTTHGLGYPILYVDEAGKMRQTWNDAFGRVIEVDEPVPANSNALDLSTCYQYNALGNLMQVSQGVQTRSYAYDSIGRVTSVTTPETNGQAMSFYYTTSGGSVCSGNPTAVCRRTDPRGITANYAYDTLNRLTGVSYTNDPNNTPSVSYSFDSTSCPVSGVSNYGKGRMTGMSDGSGSTSWCYDPAGRIVAEQRTISGSPNVTKTVQYAYNEDGTIASITYPSGRTITYTTGNAERATAAQDVANNLQYAATARACLINGVISMGRRNTCLQSTRRSLKT